MGRDVRREEPDHEVRNQPDGPLFPMVEGHELVLILRMAHQVEGRCERVSQRRRRISEVVGSKSRVVRGCGSSSLCQRHSATDSTEPEARLQIRDCTP